MNWFVKLFYTLKAFIPRRIQLYLRRRLVHIQLKNCSSVWPINRSAAKIPDGWRGWPDNKQFALVLTHDVERENGMKKVRQLAEIEMKYRLRSVFNLVPERYPDNPALRSWLIRNGFEVGVHDLKHDGRLFSSLKRFKKNASKINRYLKEWNSCGFRAGSMHHNLQWISHLDISYDASTFDTDPFEPQSDGVNTIFPFWYQPEDGGKKGFVELPYTLIQDFTLFIVMQEKTNNIWKMKLDWIARNGGMALVIVHPDYICFEQRTAKKDPEQYPLELYCDFLDHIQTVYQGLYWNPLPSELAEMVREKSILHPI